MTQIKERQHWCGLRGGLELVYLAVHTDIW